MSEDTTPPEGDTSAPTAAELEKWKQLARQNEAKAKANAEAAKRLEELENQQKSDAERAADAQRAADERARRAESDAARLRVALRKGLTEVQARRLVGDTEEELEADADDLLASFRPPKAETDGEGTEPEPPPSPSPGPPRRPEPLSGGSTPSADPEPDIRAVVDSIPRGL